MGNCKTALVVLPLCLLMPWPPVLGQTEPLASAATISVDVDLVLLHVIVTDRKLRFISGLNKENFQVFEDRAPQTIRFFQHEDVPVAVGLIVDNSGSMGRKRKDVTAAALTFVRSSNPRDQMFVVNFNEHVSFGLPETTLSSASSEELERALNGIPATGRTALYDAIEAGLGHLKKTTLDNKVLIVISDGGDNASHARLSEVLEAASRSDVTIYTVGLFDEDDRDRNPGILKKIARATGGEAFLPNETSDVVPICKRIAEDIRKQYTIGYVPSDQKLDDTYRTIRIAVTGPHHERYEARTRAGYIASSGREEVPANPKESRR
jgi:Ca-activated chloride channel homolog